MNLLEFEGKMLMSQYGMHIPKSALLTSVSSTPPLPYPFVLKAQVFTGGRGKAGGIRACNNEKEYIKNTREILEMNIKGHPVHAILAEEMVKTTQELYLSITLQNVSRPTLIFSATGGMDIEEISKNNPEEIIMIDIDPFTGLKKYQKELIATKLPNIDKQEIFSFLDKVQASFFRSKAILVEINPVGVVNGSLVAMDSKVILDDHAGSMRETFEIMNNQREMLLNWEAPNVEHTTVTYVPMDGDVALISDGAGTGMLTLDLLNDNNLKIGSFCELGGMTSVEVMSRALELSLTNRPHIKGVFISLIGGFNRMDNMAEAIVKYVEENKVIIPIYTRMCGNMEEIGIEKMKDAGLVTYDVLLDAVNDFSQTIQGGTC